MINNGPDEGDDTKELDNSEKEESWMEEENSEGQLTVDMYQTPSEIIIEAMVAGVKPDDLHVSITREMITLKGSRERSHEISEDNYFYKEGCSQMIAEKIIFYIDELHGIPSSS